MAQMMMLSAEDAAALRGLLAAFKRGTLNPKPPRSDPGDQDPNFAPEVYVALTPSGGISPLVEESTTGTGTGTGTHGDFNDVPGSATCDVYRLMTVAGGPALIPVTGVRRVVRNLSTTAIEEHTWVLAVRDKYGEWYAVSKADGTGGAVIVRTPDGGIPALAENTTGTGTGTVLLDDVPGSAECEVYKIVDGAFSPVGPPQIVVWNIFPVPIAGNRWILAVKDDYGKWIAAGPNGLFVSDVDGSPIYQPIHGIEFDSTEGVLLSQPRAGVVRVSVPAVKTQETGGTPPVYPTRILEFNSSQFNVADAGAGKATIDLVAGTGTDVLTVTEYDLAPSVSPVTEIRFNQDSEMGRFVVSQLAAGVAGVDMEPDPDYGEGGVSIDFMPSNYNTYEDTDAEVTLPDPDGVYFLEAMVHVRGMTNGFGGLTLGAEAFCRLYDTTNGVVVPSTTYPVLWIDMSNPNILHVELRTFTAFYDPPTTGTGGTTIVLQALITDPGSPNVWSTFAIKTGSKLGYWRMK